MKKVILNNKGELIAQDLQYFGGKYSFLERFRMDGIGSPRLIYKSGIPYFDELNDFIENEIPFANFELLKNGFIIRLNRNQKLRSVGLQLKELTKIKLFGLLNQDEGVRSRVELYTKDNGILCFEVIVQNFKGVEIFFKKKQLRDKLERVFEAQ